MYVNRLWHHLFGRGLVRTVDNFGTTGEPPSHPALLDYLAHRFLKQGGSTKQLIRTLVLSGTYRLSTDDQPGGLKEDPENVLLWRRDRRSLNAEAMRDAILQISGNLKRGRHESMLPGAASSDSALNNAKLDYPAIVAPPQARFTSPSSAKKGATLCWMLSILPIPVSPWADVSRVFARPSRFT